MKNRLTGEYLSGRRFIPVPQKRREPNGKWIKVSGARENNLKNIDVAFPLGVFTCVTGVSGSGKSTLVNEILLKELARHWAEPKRCPASTKKLKARTLNKIINIDQSPIGQNAAFQSGNVYRGV